jgi:myosin-5
MKAVASRVTEKSDVLLLTAVDMEDSGPYEIAEPRVITALETYTPSCESTHLSLILEDYLANKFSGLQTPRLKRLAEIVSQQAIAQQEKMDYDMPNGDGGEVNGNGINHDTIQEEIAA